MNDSGTYEDVPPGLLSKFTDWQIDAGPHAWTATRKRGTEVRVIVAHSAPELAAKLAAVESGETP